MEIKKLTSTLAPLRFKVFLVVRLVDQKRKKYDFKVFLCTSKDTSKRLEKFTLDPIKNQEDI